MVCCCLTVVLFQGFMFPSRGPDIFHLSLTWHFCWALLSNVRVNRLNTETPWSWVAELILPAAAESWRSPMETLMPSLPTSVSDELYWPMNIHECAEGLHASQWFLPVSSSYANDIITSLHELGSLSLSAINDAGKMFSVPLKMSSFKTKLLPILIEVHHNLIGRTHFPIRDSLPLMTTKMLVCHQ